MPRYITQPDGKGVYDTYFDMFIPEDERNRHWKGLKVYLKLTVRHIKDERDSVRKHHRKPS